MQRPEAANMRFGSPADVHGRVVALFVALGSFLSALKRIVTSANETKRPNIRYVTWCRISFDFVTSRCPEVGKIGEHNVIFRGIFNE